MAGKRDYKAEYQRRIANGGKRGLSRSQARGHARAGEAPIRKTIKSDDKLEAALKALRRTGNQSEAAKEARVSAERLRRFLRDNGLAQRRGKRWHVTDNRAREMTVITGGKERRVTLRDAEQASLNGEHLNAVRAFLRTNDIDLLRPFEGQAVIDARGKAHPLETNAPARWPSAAQAWDANANSARRIRGREHLGRRAIFAEFHPQPSRGIPQSRKPEIGIRSVRRANYR